MKLRITHRTEYQYSQPVRNNTNELRVQPIHNEWQERLFFILRVLPSVRIRRFTDLCFNWVHHFEIEEPHQKLTIESQSVVRTHSRYQDGPPPVVPLSELAQANNDEEIHPFLQSSRYVHITPSIWRHAIDAQAGKEDIFAVANAIMESVHDRCTYVSGVTGVNTTSAEFDQDPRGVCQDFTHLMLAMCRSIQLPARYVSGYLYDAKRREIRGAHASHAWCDVFLPGHGWFGLDPTNRRLVDHDYVAVAVGRDYDDVAPVKGAYRGGMHCTMQVSVHIDEV